MSTSMPMSDGRRGGFAFPSPPPRSLPDLSPSSAKRSPAGRALFVRGGAAAAAIAAAAGGDEEDMKLSVSMLGLEDWRFGRNTLDLDLAIDGSTRGRSDSNRAGAGTGAGAAGTAVPKLVLDTLTSPASTVTSFGPRTPDTPLFALAGGSSTTLRREGAGADVVPPRDDDGDDDQNAQPSSSLGLSLSGAHYAAHDEHDDPVHVGPSSSSSPAPSDMPSMSAYRRKRAPPRLDLSSTNDQFHARFRSTTTAAAVDEPARSPSTDAGHGIEAVDGSQAAAAGELPIASSTESPSTESLKTVASGLTCLPRPDSIDTFGLSSTLSAGFESQLSELLHWAEVEDRLCSSAADDGTTFPEQPLKSPVRSSSPLKSKPLRRSRSTPLGPDDLDSSPSATRPPLAPPPNLPLPPAPPASTPTATRPAKPTRPLPGVPPPPPPPSSSSGADDSSLGVSSATTSSSPPRRKRACTVDARPSPPSRPPPAVPTPSPVCPLPPPHLPSEPSSAVLLARQATLLSAMYRTATDPLPSLPTSPLSSVFPVRGTASEEARRIDDDDEDALRGGEISLKESGNNHNNNNNNNNNNKKGHRVASNRVASGRNSRPLSGQGSGEEEEESSSEDDYWGGAGGGGGGRGGGSGGGGGGGNGGGDGRGGGDDRGHPRPVKSEDSEEEENLSSDDEEEEEEELDDGGREQRQKNTRNGRTAVRWGADEKKSFDTHRSSDESSADSSDPYGSASDSDSDDRGGGASRSVSDYGTTEGSSRPMSLRQHARVPSTSRRRGERDGEEEKQEEEEESSDSDEVPLAKRIPGALTAQKSIRHQAKADRDARRLAKEAREKERIKMALEERRRTGAAAAAAAEEGLNGGHFDGGYQLSPDELTRRLLAVQASQGSPPSAIDHHHHDVVYADTLRAGRTRRVRNEAPEPSQHSVLTAKASTRSLSRGRSRPPALPTGPDGRPLVATFAMPTAGPLTAFHAAAAAAAASRPVNPTRQATMPIPSSADLKAHMLHQQTALVRSMTERRPAGARGDPASSLAMLTPAQLYARQALMSSSSPSPSSSSAAAAAGPSMRRPSGSRELAALEKTRQDLNPTVSALAGMSMPSSSSPASSSASGALSPEDVSAVQPLRWRSRSLGGKDVPSARPMALFGEAPPLPTTTLIPPAPPSPRMPVPNPPPPHAAQDRKYSLDAHSAASVVSSATARGGGGGGAPVGGDSFQSQNPAALSPHSSISGVPGHRTGGPDAAPPHLSAARRVQYRVYVGNRQRYTVVETSASARAAEVVREAMVKVLSPSEAQANAAGAWVLWESSFSLGIERPLREYEIVSEIVENWTAAQDFLILKRTELSSYLTLKSVPATSPRLAGWVYWQVRKGKWSKRWLELRDHSLYHAKSEKGRDEMPVCALSNFDVYIFGDGMKGPKAYGFALRSQDPVTIFENPELDYVHYFSLSDPAAHRDWVRAILNARTYILRQERAALFRPPPEANPPSSPSESASPRPTDPSSSTGGGGGGGLSRRGTVSSRPQRRLVDQPDFPRHLGGKLNDGPFQEGSLLATSAVAPPALKGAALEQAAGAVGVDARTWAKLDAGARKEVVAAKQRKLRAEGQPLLNFSSAALGSSRR